MSTLYLTRRSEVSRAEKDGVGGSTPSRDTIILKNLAESQLALPVRSQSTSVCGVAENRSQHCLPQPCDPRSHCGYNTAGSPVNLTSLWRSKVCTILGQF